MSVRCSFAIYNSELCGIYNRFPLENQPVKLVDCNRDIFNHLRTLNLSVGSTERGFKVHHDIMCEADLLCRRVGLFNTNYSLSVCPLHRAKLGIAFKQTKVCTHPHHNGKGRTFRGVNSQQSRKILEDHGVLLPVGSGICYQCYTKITKNISTEQDTSYSNIEPPASLNVQSEVYSFRERKPNSSIFESGLNLDSQLSASTQSDNLSQISTWSDEMDTSLDDINSTIQTISKGSISPLKYQLRTDYEHLKESSKRAVKRKTHTVVHAVLSCIAPGQERKLLKLIQPDESDDQETRCTDMVQLIVHLFHESSNGHTKRQLLSMICQKYTKKELQDMIPGLSTYCIDQARLHASEHGKGVPVPKKGEFFRQRLDQDKLAHALEFFFNPTFNQVCSFGTRDLKLQNGEVIQIPDVVRTLCHSTFIKTYLAFCKESEFQALSMSTLYKILQSCPASKRTSLKGLDNIAADGAAAYEYLSRMITDLKSHSIEDNQKIEDIVKKIHTSKVYLKTDFKLHVQMDDPCPDHCIRYALSDSSSPNLKVQCQHSHLVMCDRCNLFPNAISELKLLLSNKRNLTEEKKLEMLSDIDISENNIARWKEHIVRSINQDKGRTNTLEELKKDEALIILDWAMKFLPMSFREKQSDWYGQKGTNWHVSVCVFKDDLNNLKHRTYAHIFDAAKQDWFSVASILEHLICTLKIQIPNIDTVYLRSDNAGCYHCGNLWLSLMGISERTGIHISRYDFSEAQCGKSYCDAKIAHMRGRIRQYVANGNNVRNATEMKAAIDSFGGIVGCQAANVQIDLQKQTSFSHCLKGITKINNISLNKDLSMTTWRSFGIGKGTVLSKDEVSSMSPVTQGDTGLIIIEDFKEPCIVEGKVKQNNESRSDHHDDQLEPNTPTENLLRTEDVLYCPEEGCTRVFKTFSGLETHQFVGKHKFILNKISTFDEIKLKWKECCDDVTEKVTMERNDVVLENTKTIDLPMGWALSKDKKIIRFSDKVKTFLRGIFQGGAQGGKKVNAVDVANHMRVCLDEEGNKMFQPHEYLQQGQIASFFSRLAVMAKIPPKRRQTVDDADLESVVAHLNSIEAIEIINNDV